MERITSFFDDILKIAAGISLFLVICGYINIYSYYYFYSIDISPYINPSDLIVGIIPTFLYFLIVLVGTVPFLFLMLENVDVFENLQNEKYWLVLYQICIFFVLFFIDVAQFVIIQETVFRNKFEIGSSIVRTFHYYVWLAPIFIILIATAKFIKLENSLYSKYNLTLLRGALILGPLTPIFLILNNKISFDQRKNSVIQKNAVLNMANGKRLILTDSVILLGKSDNYYFLWNRISGEKEIISSSEIKEIQLP